MKFVARKLLELVIGVATLIALTVILLFEWLDLDPVNWPRLNHWFQVTCDGLDSLHRKLK